MNTTDQITPPETQEVVQSSAHHIIISETEDKRARWYIVHTYSGHENKVAETLKQRAQTLGLTDHILEILVPTQEKIQIKVGQR
jgi:hypothetical protein